MDVPLVGGNTTVGVVRVGGTVRRPRGSRSEFAAAVVTWLNAHDFPYVARYFGIDARRRDTFEYIEGTTTEHPVQRDERSYAAMGRILRELHDLTTRRDDSGRATALLHGDPGPFNVVCRDGMPVALIDWDSSRVGEPLDDFGYAAWTWCAGDHDGTTAAEQATRLRAFRDAYDPTMTADGVLDAIERAQQSIITAESAVLDDPRRDAARRGHAERAIGWAESDRRYLSRHLREFADALGDPTV